MVTTHQYLDKYPIPRDSEKLILGTIHPHDHLNFEVQFFYGNKLSLWNILNEAFDEQMGTPITLERILKFLKERKIAVSDTIIECERIKPTALDKDLKPRKLNNSLIAQIKESNIHEILFTSGFEKNNAFKLFYVDILGLNITPQIRRERSTVLNPKYFSRPIKLTIIYSPSGSSNVPLSTSKLYQQQKHKYSKSVRPVYDFKVDYYREQFTTFPVGDIMTAVTNL